METFVIIGTYDWQLCPGDYLLNIGSFKQNVLLSNKGDYPFSVDLIPGIN